MSALDVPTPCLGRSEVDFFGRAHKAHHLFRRKRRQHLHHDIRVGMAENNNFATTPRLFKIKGERCPFLRIAGRQGDITGFSRNRTAQSRERVSLKRQKDAVNTTKMPVDCFLRRPRSPTQNTTAGLSAISLSRASILLFTRRANRSRRLASSRRHFHHHWRLLSPCHSTVSLPAPAVPRRLAPPSRPSYPAHLRPAAKD